MSSYQDLWQYIEPESFFYINTEDYNKKKQLSDDIERKAKSVDRMVLLKELTNNVTFNLKSVPWQVNIATQGDMQSRNQSNEIKYLLAYLGSASVAAYSIWFTCIHSRNPYPAKNENSMMQSLHMCICITGCKGLKNKNIVTYN